MNNLNTNNKGNSFTSSYTSSSTSTLSRSETIIQSNNKSLIQGEIIYTMGPPGSGKSTWAKQKVRELEDQGIKVVRIELDEMREEFGVSPDNRESELFSNLLQERNKRINSYLNKGYVVILSDTFMSDKAKKEIKRLSKQKNVSKVTKQDFTHIPLETCLERDKQRKEQGFKYAGESVIRRMYQTIRPNDLVDTHERCLVIGDVHGDYERLKKLLNHVQIEYKDNTWLNPLNVFVVFLGDLNDTRLSSPLHNENRSAYKCLRWAKELSDLSMSVCVQSNHGFNLISYLKGKKKKLSHGLDYTVNELNNLNLTQEELDGLLDWLENQPYFYMFNTGRGKKVTCVHAEYTPGMSQYNPEGKAKNAVMYGSHLEGVDEKGYRLRVPWWDVIDVPEEELYICGHYHMFKAVPNWDNPKAIVLDSGCGSDKGTLSGYYMNPESDSVITF